LKILKGAFQALLELHPTKIYEELYNFVQGELDPVIDADRHPWLNAALLFLPRENLWRALDKIVQATGIARSGSLENLKLRRQRYTTFSTEEKLVHLAVVHRKIICNQEWFKHDLL
jgi:hypothetical protein